jgi:S-adenosyl methyltransferase
MSPAAEDPPRSRAHPSPSWLLTRGNAEAVSRFNPTVPHPARVYNAWLGGKDNHPADRDAADEVIRHSPQVVAGALANRHFLARVVRFLVAECGIRQFLDIGTGLPAPDNTHEIAQRITPASRIVYIDNDRYKSGCAHERLTGQAA